MTIKSSASKKHTQHSVVVMSKKMSTKRLPDLTEFRKSIHIKGKPLSQGVIKGRG